MILITGSSEREVVDLQQGDYEEMDQLAIAKPLCKAAFRVLHAADIGIGVARAIRAAVSGRPGGVYLDLPAKLFGQVMDAEAGQKSLVKVIDAAPAQIPAPAAVKRALDVLKSAKRPLIILGKGAAYAQADDADPRLRRKERHSVPADEHGQGPAARHASAMRRRRALDRAEGHRRRDDDRRAAQLAACRTARARTGASRTRRSSSRSTSSRGRWTATSRSPRRWSAISAPASPRLLDGMGDNWPAPPADWTGAISKKREENVAKMAPRLMNNNVPMDYHGALGVLRTIIKERPDAILVNEGANTLDLARGVIDMYQPRKRLDVGTWGVMGIGMGYAIAAAIETGKPVLAIEGDSAFGFSGMEVETICRYNLPVCVVIFNNDGIYRGTDVNRSGGCGPGDDRLRQGLALRQDDGGVRRRRRQCDHARRAEARRQRGDGFRQADAHQRGDRPGGRQRERPHRQSQSAKRAEEKMRIPCGRRFAPPAAPCKFEFSGGNRQWLKRNVRKAKSRAAAKKPARKVVEARGEKAGEEGERQRQIEWLAEAEQQALRAGRPGAATACAFSTSPTCSRGRPARSCSPTWAPT